VLVSTGKDASGKPITVHEAVVVPWMSAIRLSPGATIILEVVLPRGVEPWQAVQQPHQMLHIACNSGGNMWNPTTPRIILEGALEGRLTTVIEGALSPECQESLGTQLQAYTP
jgi:hypothetical protein